MLSGPGQFKVFGPQDGLGPGPHFEIYEDSEHSLWICGADGLSRLSGDRFLVVSRANGLPAGGVFGLTEDDEHNLWLSTSAGIIRLAALGIRRRGGQSRLSNAFPDVRHV